MTIEELRFIVLQQEGSGLWRTFYEDWITDELLAEAFDRINVSDEIYKKRLELVIGVKRKDYGQLSLPKKSGSYLKPSFHIAEWAIRKALIRLLREVRRLKPAIQPSISRELICPHCGGALSFKIRVTQK